MSLFLVTIARSGCISLLQTGYLLDFARLVVVGHIACLTVAGHIGRPTSMMAADGLQHALHDMALLAFVRAGSTQLCHVSSGHLQEACNHLACLHEGSHLVHS